MQITDLHFPRVSAYPMHGLIINLILQSVAAGGLALQTVWLVDDRQLSVG